MVTTTTPQQDVASKAKEILARLNAEHQARKSGSAPSPSPLRTPTSSNRTITTQSPQQRTPSTTTSRTVILKTPSPIKADPITPSATKSKSSPKPLNDGHQTSTPTPQTPTPPPSQLSLISSFDEKYINQQGIERCGGDVGVYQRMADKEKEHYLDALSKGDEWKAALRRIATPDGRTILEAFRFETVIRYEDGTTTTIASATEGYHM
ncbi:hypothetical protein HDV00_012035, partial [Rhizophlyctis rosea]